ncbi:MAG: fumarylacetoacetate hydrolase family protein [Vicinamibacteria bacterium]
MKVLQVVDAGGGARLAFLEEGGRVSVLEAAHGGVASALDFLVAVGERGLDAAAWRKGAAFAQTTWEALQSDGRLALPVTPAEVWGAGVTYQRSADFREEGTGIYDRVYAAPRPELFFKATAARCVAHGQAIGRRRDSTFTASEPELAVVVGASGTILGYTLANDVSAWDIERDNPLYLPQSKCYAGCFAFGPVVVTADAIADPLALALTCTVDRGGREVFAGSASTSQLKRPLGELVDWLRRSNPIPDGTVLSTGTGIIQPMDVGLEEGDVVSVSCPEIGTLTNPVAWV